MKLIRAVIGLTLLLSLAPGLAAQAADPQGIVVRDGKTQPVFDYADAIRQRVWVTCEECDGDRDGTADRIAMDIIRPRTDTPVPVIVDASPYFTTVGRGNEGELIGDTDGDGINDKWPLFYDNYFVPRGYAVVLLHIDGTGRSTGCTDEGGRNDILSARAGVSWLAAASWSNGRVGMIGKSYDGTIANGVAATGVVGLKTIVPISAISSWYDYSRAGGITFSDDYPAWLSEYVTNPGRREHCQASRDWMSAHDGDESGDYTDFWAERDYRPDVSKVKASVFVVHGLQDDNVQTQQFARWWSGLDVPRKIWLAREGHIDPFDFRRSEWVSTLHKWFDYWLQGVPNDVLTQPRVDLEHAADEWETHADWPLPGTRSVHAWMASPAADGPGSLTLQPFRGGERVRSYTDNPRQTEAAMIGSPGAESSARLAFLSQPLQKPLRISGTPTVSVLASADKKQANLGAVLVDYGPATHVSREGDGIATNDAETCWGASSSADDACYHTTRKLTADVDLWRVSKGILDSSNRDSLSAATPMTPGERYRFDIELLPDDYVFPAGHQIGVVVVGSYPEYYSQPSSSRATVDVAVNPSRISLPVVGGRAAAQSSGAFDAGPVVVPERTVQTDVLTTPKPGPKLPR